jgi:glyoxylase-like metal-dependent hydrolase (beta-lactamase superfamily II)
LAVPLSSRPVPGLELIHLPGHTPGLQGLLVDLDETGPILLVSDQLIFEEHLTERRPQGWLLRNDEDWHRSVRTIQRIVANTSA